MVVRDVADGAREHHGARHLADDPDGPPASMTFGAPGTAANVEAENFCQLEASLRNRVRYPSV
jgi:hypothetical protein